MELSEAISRLKGACKVTEGNIPFAADTLKFDQFSNKSGDTNGIVSGTFEFTVRNEELDSIVEITNGKFQYIIDYEWY